MAHWQERKLRVAKRRYSEHFPQVAVERLRGCANIVALAKGLGVSRRQLYRWRDELDPEEPALGKVSEQKSRVSTLRKEVNHLKRVLAEKTLEVDFFKGALQKVEARRQKGSGSGGRHLRRDPRSNADARQPEVSSACASWRELAEPFSTDVCRNGSRWKKAWKYGRHLVERWIALHNFLWSYFLAQHVRNELDWNAGPTIDEALAAKRLSLHGPTQDAVDLPKMVQVVCRFQADELLDRLPSAYLVDPIALHPSCARDRLQQS